MPLVFGLFRRRQVLGVARAPGRLATITVRLATGEDAQAVARLAALYDRPLPRGPMLLAVVDGELQAALTLADDRELMEPYLPTAGLVDLLALRADQLRDRPRSRFGRYRAPRASGPARTPATRLRTAPASFLAAFRPDSTRARS